MAKRQLQALYQYIKQDSPLIAKKVIDDLLDVTIGLVTNPEKYPLDKYKIPNDGSFRAFELNHYGIS